MSKNTQKIYIFQNSLIQNHNIKTQHVADKLIAVIPRGRPGILRLYCDYNEAQQEMEK